MSQTPTARTTLSRCRVGMAQIHVEGGQPDANLRRAEEAVERLGALDCDVAVLPECLDLGWTDESARRLAEPIPGSHLARLASAAQAASVYLAAGLVERAGDKLYNAAVLIDPRGELVLHYRKINELDIALDLYGIGDRLAIAETPFGTVGLSICADNFGNSLALGHVLARMGAQIILSPCAWAVSADHDQQAEPYGQLWRDSYSALAELYDLVVVGVSNVGPMTSGPWAGRKCIGCSLAVGPQGILMQGPYGQPAALTVEVELKAPIGRGTAIAPALGSRGYRGP